MLYLLICFYRLAIDAKKQLIIHFYHTAHIPPYPETTFPLRHIAERPFAITRKQHAIIGIYFPKTEACFIGLAAKQ